MIFAQFSKGYSFENYKTVGQTSQSKIYITSQSYSIQNSSPNNLFNIFKNKITKCMDPTCGAYIPNEIWENKKVPCLPSDIGIIFSSCKNGTRLASSFYKPPVFCTGGEPLPDSKYVPCDNSTCEAGKFYNLNTLECELCKPGYYMEDQYTFDNMSLLSPLPTQFTTWCYYLNGENKPCNYWIRNDLNYFHSNNFQKDDVFTALKYSTKLIENSIVSFEYQVFGEKFFQKNYDFFKFSVKYLDSNTEKILLIDAEAFDWTSVQFQLSPGFVELIWSYQKDSVASLQDPKADNVFIRNLKITNHSSVEYSCLPCPEGYISKEGSTTCIPCPANTYNPVKGGKICLPCKLSEFSNEGSSNCTLNQIICNKNDYYALYTPCINNVRTKYYTWIQPKICAINSVLPTNSTESCQLESCYPGEMRINSEPCFTCPEETYSEKGKVCDLCLSPKVPSIRELHINDFTKFNFTTGCIGDCISTWRATKDYIFNYHLNILDRTWLEFDVKMLVNTPATLKIKYIFNCKSFTTKPVFRIYINNLITNTLTCNSIDNELSVTIPNQLHSTYARIKFEIEKFDTQPNDQIMNINSLSIVNSAEGGFTTCNACPSGTRNINFKCINCPSGYYRRTEDIDCLPCPENTFSREGSTYCLPCGNGMTSTSGSSICKWIGDHHSYKQKSKSGEYIFQFDKLDSQLEGQFVDLGDWKYFLNLNAHFNSKRIVDAIASWRLSDVFTDSLFNTLDDTEQSQFNQLKSLNILTSSKNNFNSMNTINFQQTAKNNLLNSNLYTTKIVTPNSLILNSLSNNLQRSKLNNIEEILSHASNIQACNYDTFACRVKTNGDVEDLGITAEFQVIEDNLRIISNNPNQICNFNSSETITTIIDLHCLPIDKIMISVQENGCSFHYVVESIHACPICTEDSFVAWKDECQNGERTVQYLQKSICFGGFVPPPPSTTTEGCSNIILNQTAWISIILLFIGLIIIILFSILTVAIVCVILIRKNRQLKYGLLIKNRVDQNLRDEEFELTEEEFET